VAAARALAAFVAGVVGATTAAFLPALKIPAAAVPENVNSADATPAVRNRAEVARR